MRFAELQPCADGGAQARRRRVRMRLIGACALAALLAVPLDRAWTVAIDDSAERLMRDGDLAAGTAAAKAGDYAAAIGLLRRALAVAPEDADAHAMLAFSLRKSGDLSAARVHYREALRIDPNHRPALAYVAEWYLQAGDRETALALRARLAALCPDGCEPLSQLDRILAGDGK